MRDPFPYDLIVSLMDRHSSGYGDVSVKEEVALFPFNVLTYTKETRYAASQILTSGPENYVTRELSRHSLAMSRLRWLS